MTTAHGLYRDLGFVETGPYVESEIPYRHSAPLGGLLGAVILWFSPVRTLMVLPGRPASDGTRPRTPAEVVIDVERDQPIGF